MVSAVFLASQRKVIRTIAFRTDQPQFTSIGQNHARKSLRTRHKRGVVVLDSLSGRRTELPIEECTLVDGKAQDRLTINVPGYWPFVVDVQNAELGWPGTTELIGKFEKNEKDPTKEGAQRALRDQRAKGLMKLLWQTHSGSNRENRK
ncbi:hypothetical protein FRC20_000350 [Serendipita sp. 405]|nr:hypothetical protein FRC16_006300 [Serendipita sp. 398]KAG8857117.1 hypothetical protein FRC20_000350 [Serendipita sp. 405]